MTSEQIFRMVTRKAGSLVGRYHANLEVTGKEGFASSKVTGADGYL